MRHSPLTWRPRWWQCGCSCSGQCASETQHNVTCILTTFDTCSGQCASETQHNVTCILTTFDTCSGQCASETQNNVTCFFYALRWNKLIFHCSSIFFTTVKNIIVMPVSPWLTLFCTPVHLNKHNITLIKLGTNDVNMMTSRRYCFPRYNVFDFFSLKETENLWY